MQKFKSLLVDKTLAQQAVALCLPMIAAGLESQEVGASGFLYIVVMKPGITPHDATFQEAILYEHAVGDTSQWDADYGQFARAKAELSWRTGMDSHLVRETHPHLLAEGDSLLWGGLVRDGLVVAVSGADPWFDEVFAGAVAMTIRALAQKKLARVADQPWLVAESV
ncbi:phosphoenolpyruvate synthase [Novimethylophilus kurashikiensis]|uniref:Phosphoenolpyruvate synthase n=1 Tax=Novimethylophilus kurashikiensis TaxID=1825523 RepID=A0A2R5F4D0_9PROT|nr:hypothetical protein [Novimethylophilus kurashikiensis]GBG12608.1 phosphoenolpyruvate synthase [Novimethylophilus kurashikiensis]